MSKSRLLVGLCLIVFCVTACSSRVPSAKTAQHSALSYYKRYGHKFPSTVYGSKNVANVTINAIEEVSYRFALVDTIVDFVDGHKARTLIKMERKVPTGWQVASWEVLGYQ